MDADTGEGVSEENFNKASPDAAIIVFKLPENQFIFFIKTPNFITNDKICVA